MAHAERDHATWSASSTERNWNCPGALALTKDLPETTSEAADWGTACHQVAEKCLRTGKDAAEFIGTTEKGKKHSFEVDDEMAETAQTYVDYVRALGGNPKIEQRFSLSPLNPPFDAGGTADAVVYREDTKTLEVVDLKGGRGHVVEVVGNPQLRTYGLGALLCNKDFDVEHVKVTIVQPRAPHKSGRIRSETFHVADLMEWTTELMRAMKRSSLALSDKAGRDKDGTIATWAAEWLKAGDHCKFCKAAGFCPALQQKALDAAGVWFDDLSQPRLANSPDAMSPEALAAALDAADMISDWINAVRAYAHTQAEMGVTIPNYQLVDSIGRRRWTDEGEAISRLVAAGHDPFTKKAVSPAQAEKLLGKKQAGLIADLIEKPITGTNLVRADKTTRSAVAPAVNKHFSTID